MSEQALTNTPEATRGTVAHEPGCRTIVSRLLCSRLAPQWAVRLAGFTPSIEFTAPPVNKKAENAFTCSAQKGWDGLEPSQMYIEPPVLLCAATHAIHMPGEAHQTLQSVTVEPVPYALGVLPLELLAP